MGIELRMYVLIRLEDDARTPNPSSLSDMILFTVPMEEPWSYIILTQWTRSTDFFLATIQFRL